MSEYRVIAQNVMDFLEKASVSYGKMQEDFFSQDMFTQLVEGKINSPIEDLFFIAFNLQCAAEVTTVNPNPVMEVDGSISEGYGVVIKPQAKIGNYRVDFLISISPANGLPDVVVELDGHDFHDKDKHQRAYEKSRDRFLVQNGYKVLHFTGSEIVADPNKAAFEALFTLGGVLGRGGYDPLDPTGREE